MLQNLNAGEIPWELYGVNYVVETNDSLNTFNDGRNHLRSVEKVKHRDLNVKIMANKLMYIPNDNTQNYPFCRLQLVVENYGHLTK